jgi:hypothetical protein
MTRIRSGFPDCDGNSVSAQADAQGQAGKAAADDGDGFGRHGVS